MLLSINFATAQVGTPFVAANQPAAPDYSLEQNWNALPFRKDKADFTPKREKAIADADKAVDVFYIYPTFYKEGTRWNADVKDKKLNKKIDRLALKYQAATFNNVGRVYSPRYRQATIESFSDTTGHGKAALAFAYEDIKRAFDYYMAHYNQGRPIIIVSHSQGTYHSRQLLKDYFDSPKLKNKLVCAYCIGFGMFPEQYEVLTPCDNADATNCYVTWASFKEGHVPVKSALIGKVCVNPVSWRIDTLPATGMGSVIYNINRKKRYKVTVRAHNNYLWVNTNTPIVRKRNVMHPVDFNLYWFDIRANAALRVKTYLSRQH